MEAGAPTLGSSAELFLGLRDAALRSRLGLELAKDGHQIYSTNDGIQILEWLADGLLDELAPAPDLIIADLNLRGRRGLDLLADLRCVGRRTPFILLAPPYRQRAIEQATRFEGVVVFEGPFEIDDLRTAVVWLIDRYGGPLGAFRERRAWRRADVDLAVRERGKRYARRCRDIGGGGLLIELGVPYAPGDVVDLAFRLPEDGRTIQARGEVVRVEPADQGFFVGVRFLDLPPGEREIIARYVG